jgi:hypothetical protein
MGELGLRAIDLHTCSKFLIQVYDQSNFSDYGLTYYLTHPDKSSDQKWIRCREGEEYVHDDLGARMEPYESYEQVHPIDVARDLLLRKHFGTELPAELETYREYGDPTRYSEWLRQQHQDSNSAHVAKARPKWVESTLTLSVGGLECRKFKRKTNNHQLSIIKAFDKEGWPESINAPLRDEIIVKQTIKDFNDSCTHKQFHLTQSHMLVSWRYEGPKTKFP